MIPNQRYLREKKEVNQEELNELNEVNKLNRLKASMDKLPPAPQGTPGAAQALKVSGQLSALDKLKSKKKDVASMSDSDVKSYVYLSKQAGETPPKSILDKHNQITGKKTPAPNTTDSLNKPVGQPNTTGMPGQTGIKQPVSAESIKGNTISEIIRSAGGDVSKASDISSYIRSVLKQNKINLKDENFMA